MIRGIAFSCFDLLHAGHITMLEEAKEHCNYLIAGLHTSPEHKKNVIQSCFERYIQLKGCKYVDEIIPYDSEDDLSNMLKTITPLHVRFLGEEYLLEKKIITGYNICDKRDIKLHYCRRYHNYSTTELKGRIASLSNAIES